MFLVVLFGINEVKGQTYILNDNFGGTAFPTSNGNVSSSGTAGPSNLSWTASGSWVSSTSAYQAGQESSTYNCLKLGGSGSSGSISTTSTLNLSVNGGDFSISLDYKGWTTVEGNILVSVNGGTPQTLIPTQTLASTTFNTATLNFTGGTANSYITIATSSKRAFIANVKVFYTASANTVTAASTAPTLCVNTALTAITHTTTGATGIGTTTTNYGLPSGVTAAWANNTITISGTPTTSGTFNYNIPLTGGSGSVNATGTITVNPVNTATASNNGPYCSGATIQLTGGPSGLSSYTWSGPNSYSSSNVTQTVSQNFDSLSTGTSWTDNSTLPGWYLSTTLFKIGTGSDKTGSAYNFGNNSNSTDRALGSLCSNNTVTIYYGIKITNTTGITVSSVAITYTGEQYRDAGNTSPIAQNLTVDYSTDATTLTTAPGTWTPVPALTFSTPIYTTTAAALDGNVSANRVAGITTTLTGLSIPNGSSIWVRWADQNDSGNDAAVAIDDVSIVLSAGNSSPSIINATTQMSGNYSLNVVDSNGCNSTATTNVVVNPVPNITISGNATICAGASTTLSATGASSYLWSNSLGINPSINVTPSSNTQYTVTGTNSYNCTNNASINVTVNPNPSTTLIYHQ